MTIAEIIRLALDDCGWTQKTLANKCGYKTQSAIANKIAQGNLRIETLINILDAMGYDLVVVSKNPNKNKARWIVTSLQNDVTNEKIDDG